MITSFLVFASHVVGLSRTQRRKGLGAVVYFWSAYHTALILVFVTVVFLFGSLNPSIVLLGCFFFPVKALETRFILLKLQFLVPARQAVTLHIEKMCIFIGILCAFVSAKLIETVFIVGVAVLVYSPLFDKLVAVYWPQIRQVKMGL